MRLGEVRLKSDHNYTESERQALEAAVVWGQKPSWDEQDPSKIKYYWTDYLMDLDAIPPLPHEITKVVLNHTLDVAVEKRVPMFNERVQVVVPGLGLMLINKVTVLTDYCTDGLQGFLVDGWRILAICPQPNQRRPDYVLGRVEQVGSP